MGATDEVSPQDLVEIMRLYKENGGEMDPSKVPPDVRHFVESFQKLDTTNTNTTKTDSEEIKPEAGFVVKCKDDNGRKIFINMCSSDKIAAPGSWENGKVPDDILQKLEEANTSVDESLRFPLSLGDEIYELDKKGEPCSTFDCVFNSDVLKQAMAVKQLKVFLIELALGWIQQKHHLILDPKYKLPRMKYKGERMHTQLIRKENKSLIEEIGSEEDVVIPLCTKPRTPTVQMPEHIKSGKKTAPIEEYSKMSNPSGRGEERGLREEVHVEMEFEGSPISSIVVKASKGSPFNLNGTGLEVSLVGNETLEISIDGAKKTLQLPFAVDASTSKVSIQGNNAIHISLPFKPFDVIVEEMRQAAPHKFGTLKLSDSSFLDLE